MAALSYNFIYRKCVCSSFQICRSCRKYRHIQIPAKAWVRNKNAAPEHFPLPKSFTRRLPAPCTAMIGSKTWSTRNPPRHQTRGVRPNASRKFSVLMEKSRQLQITRIRLHGAFRKAARRLPEIKADPLCE